MAAVAAKAITANDVRNGSCVVLGTRNGDSQVISDRAVTYPAVSAIETKWTDRWDDVRYYSGDTSS